MPMPADVPPSPTPASRAVAILDAAETAAGLPRARRIAPASTNGSTSAAGPLRAAVAPSPADVGTADAAEAEAERLLALAARVREETRTASTRLDRLAAQVADLERTRASNAVPRRLTPAPVGLAVAPPQPAAPTPAPSLPAQGAAPEAAPSTPTALAARVTAPAPTLLRVPVDPPAAAPAPATPVGLDDDAPVAAPAPSPRLSSTARPTPPPASPSATPRRAVTDTARIVALDLAATGLTRGEVGLRLERDYGVPDVAGVLDAAFGRGTPATHRLG